MLTDYLIIVSITATAALIWRALLLDHPALLAKVESLPYIGGALRCGFCMALWLSLLAVLLKNPIAPWTGAFHPLIAILAAWFSLSAGVLFVRNAIAILMEGTGVLTHAHRSQEGH